MNTLVDMMLLGVLFVAAMLTFLGSEKPDMDAWRWLVGPTIGIGIVLLVGLAAVTRRP